MEGYVEGGELGKFKKGERGGEYGKVSGESMVCKRRGMMRGMRWEMRVLKCGCIGGC
jgi:hypothetical protein